MMYVLGAVVLIVGAVIAYRTVTGRMEAQGCCCPSDPMQDARMRPYLLADLRAEQAAAVPGEPGATTSVTPE